MRSLNLTHVTKIDRTDVAQEEIARINNAYIANKGPRDDALCARGEPIEIVNRENGRRVVRHAAGGGTQNLAKDTLALDYFGRVQLGTTERDVAYDVVVRRASRWAVLRHYLNHPSMVVRVPARVTAFSLLLSLFWLAVSVADHLVF